MKTIYWHELTCEGHVSVDQKCSSILTSSHSMNKSCMAEFTCLGLICMYFCNDHICSDFFLDLFVFTFLCFAGGQSASMENGFFAKTYKCSVIHNMYIIVKCHLRFKHTLTFMCLPHKPKPPIAENVFLP